MFLKRQSSLKTVIDKAKEHMTVMKNISVLPELVNEHIANNADLKIFEDAHEIAKKDAKENEEI